MKLDDLLQADSATIDPQLLTALHIFGFTAAYYSLYQKKPTGEYVGVISADHKDGSSMNWIGTGTTPDDAYLDAVDALAKWILNQPIGATP